MQYSNKTLYALLAITSLFALCLIVFGVVILVAPTFNRESVSYLNPDQSPSVVPTKIANLTSTFTAIPSETNTAEPTKPPTDTSIPPTPTTQPSSTPIPTATSIPTSFTPGNEREYRAYLMAQYHSIAGNNLEIEDISIFDIQGHKSVSIQLTRHSGIYIFSNQTQADAIAYGTRLLEDTITFFGGIECSAYVDEIFYTTDIGDYFGNEWYYVGDWEDSEEGWYVSHTYVRAFYLSGRKSVDVWNYK